MFNTSVRPGTASVHARIRRAAPAFALAAAAAIFPGGGIRSAEAQTAVPLWPAGAPGATGTTDNDKPTVTAFPAASPNGAALVVFPGGGYVSLSSGYEGNQPALWFNRLGISCFVVKYRLGSNGYRHPIEMWDGQRAVRWVRANAAKYGIDPARVGVLGFSAGGHLAATVSTHFDAGSAAAADTVNRQSCRPDWSILGYPVITMDASFTHAGSRANLLGASPTQVMVDSLSAEKQVTSRTPPAFIFHAKDDGTVPVKNAQVYHDSLARRGIATELKLYEKGGHGFGLGDGVAGAAKDSILATWPVLAGQWMDRQGYFKKTVSLSVMPLPGPASQPLSPARGRFGLRFLAGAWRFSDALGRWR